MRPWRKERVMAEEYVVSIASEEEVDSGSALGALGVIWHELSGGIGPWGALRPLVAVVLSLCLLYTSPSPRDGLLSRMPSSA